MHLVEHGCHVLVDVALEFGEVGGGGESRRGRRGRVRVRRIVFVESGGELATQLAHERVHLVE